MNDFDVIIVGAGMVGLTVANLFKDTRLRVALIDKSESPVITLASGLDEPKFDSRVSALSSSSREILTRLGAWTLIEQQRYCDLRVMYVWDADGTGSITFSADDLAVPRLGTIIENSLVIEALTHCLESTCNVELIRPCSVDALEETDDWVLLHTADQGVLRTRLVIAADGANSKIRELKSFEVREWEYNHNAIVSTVKTAKPHQKIALQRFMPTGPLALLPLSSSVNDNCQMYSSIVWSAEPAYAESLMDMTDKDFCRQLSKCSESRFGEVIDCGTRQIFPLKQRHSVNYSKDRIVLVGDAAHSIHPLAGQGANLGFLDAEALTNEIKKGLNVGREVFDPVTMDRYQRARKGHNLGMMVLMEGFKRVFAEDILSVRWLRNFGMSRIDELKPIKHYLARRAMGLNI